ncbi:MAG: trypsin-like peptidase domain-containing protein [Planctomycetia bacterium]
MRAKNQTGGLPGGQGRGGVWIVSWLAVAILASVWGARAGGTEGVGLEEEAAFQAAAAAVAPAVVRVEVAGVSEAGLGGPAEASPASGPSSGFVVGADGWVVATSFAVPKDATQAVVTLPGGDRLVARVTGRDLARGLVLLKIDLPAGAPLLPVMESVPRASLAVGQWTLVLGRAWSAQDPSVGIGILSATNRAWGRAVQTDASVSPANYGGPLVDIEGRVIGVLAPLPAEAAGMMAGTELYDSGIGFAVPLEDILRVLPRLQAGETLSPGIIGIGYASRDPFTAPPVVATCRPDSPAGRAGLRVGDRIVEAGGRPVSRVAELKHAIAPLYAGDPLDLVVERGEARERLPMRVELVATLPPWRRPVLGLVPRRTGGGDAAVAGAAPPQNAAAERGVSVAWVWPDGPAARAGITAGDRIVSVRPQAGGDGGEPTTLEVTSAAILGGFLAGLDAGATVDVAIERGGESRSIAVALVEQPTAVPVGVPASEVDPATTAVERLGAAEIARPAWGVLPVATAESPLGVLVYCGQPAGGGGAAAKPARAAELDEASKQEAERWRGAATRYGIAVIVMPSSDPNRWGREDIATLARTLDGLRLRRPIDPSRIAFAGSGPGGAFAWLAAEALGPTVRGVALLESTLPRQATISPTEPGRSRAILFGTLPGAAVNRVDDDRRRLEAAGYPVGLLPDLGGAGLPTETLCSWVEALGVL